MFKSILVVCVGNICRSPTGQLLLDARLRERGADIVVSSAGLGALVGHAMAPQAAALVEKEGIDSSVHTARQLTNEIIAENDLILVMERSHMDGVFNIDPGARGKTMLLGKWLDDREIPDPYRQSDEMFERVFQLISTSCGKWAEKLG